MRRYCQALTAPAGSTPEAEHIYQLMLEVVRNSRTAPHAFKIQGGLLEQVVGKKHHPSHAALCWQNAYYGKRARHNVPERFYLRASNAPLFLYPAMIDELARLITMPKDATAAFRSLRDAQAANSPSVTP